MHKAEFQLKAFDKKAKAETSEITKGIFFLIPASSFGVKGEGLFLTS